VKKHLAGPGENRPDDFLDLPANAEKELLGRDPAAVDENASELDLGRDLPRRLVELGLGDPAVTDQRFAEPVVGKIALGEDDLAATEKDFLAHLALDADQQARRVVEIERMQKVAGPEAARVDERP